MTTVASRIVRSSPHRNTAVTWEVIVDLLTQGKDSSAKTELLSVAGIASSLIAERAPRDSAIVVTCEGPRTRIYCLFDEDAIDGSDAKEDALGYEPLKGDWKVSLPCAADDLEWVQRALNAKSSRITARNLATKLGKDEEDGAPSKALSLNVEAFLKS